jgi:hypothetical protein
MSKLAVRFCALLLASATAADAAAGGLCLAARPQAQPTPPAQPGPSAQPPVTGDDLVHRAFQRLYNYDFVGAQALLDTAVLADPANPLPYCTRAVAYLFAELGRMKILETDFFLDDDNLRDGNGARVTPDPEVKRKLFDALDQARTRSAARLAKDPNDINALFAMCMTSGVAADYTGFVERRQWRGLKLSKETNKYANQLLSRKPPFYDAYLTVGSLEYVIGSLPFFVRWFVRFDQIAGDKRKGIEAMKLVARNGRYYAPFARVLLAVASLREGKLEDARLLLTQLAVEYPENPLFTRELKHVNDRIAAKPRKK